MNTLATVICVMCGKIISEGKDAVVHKACNKCQEERKKRGRQP